MCIPNWQEKPGGNLDIGKVGKCSLDDSYLDFCAETQMKEDLSKNLGKCKQRRRV